jgi:hypothetical protein
MDLEFVKETYLLITNQVSRFDPHPLYGEIEMRNTKEAIQLGSASEFGFENCLDFFHLLTPHQQTDPNQVRPEFGLGGCMWPLLHRDSWKTEELGTWKSGVGKFQESSIPASQTPENSRAQYPASLHN